MSQAFDVAMRVQLNQPWTYNTVAGMNPSHAVICSCTAPATSVASGMIADVSDWLPNMCTGATVQGRLDGTEYDIRLEPVIDDTFRPAHMKFVAIRGSTGCLVTSAADLSDESWLIKFEGN